MRHKAAPKSALPPKMLRLLLLVALAVLIVLLFFGGLPIVMDLLTGR